MESIRGTLFFLRDKVFELFKDGKPYRTWFDRRNVDMGGDDWTVTVIFKNGVVMPLDEHYEELKRQMKEMDFRQLYLGEWIRPEDDGS